MHAWRMGRLAAAGVTLLGAPLAVLGACSSSEIGSTGSSGGPRPNAGGRDGTGGSRATGGASSAGGSSSSDGGAGGAFSTGGTGGVVGTGGAPPNAPATIDRCEDETPFEGANGAGALTWLYPYGGTVFPRGLGPPTLMWDGGIGAPTLFEMTSSGFSYRECVSYGGLRFTLPLDAWQAATDASNGPADPLTLRITVSTGDGVFTLSRDVHLAHGPLQGQLHYSSYGSAAGSDNGAVLRIRPGESAPTLVLSETGTPPAGPCVSCHSLAASGSMMVANRHSYPDGPYESRSYTLASGEVQLLAQGIPEAGFAALYPDGSRMLTNGAPNAPSPGAIFPTSPGNVGKLLQATSRLMDPTGAALTTNWDVPHAQMPSFSPDGRRVVFNDHDSGAGHSLWVAEFDAATNQFASKRQIFSDTTRYPAWPAFTPDGLQVVFVLGTSNQFVSQLPATLATVGPVTRGSLHVVDVETGTAVPLVLANGGGHLPAGDADHEHFTSVSPVASGGYFWAAFTSRRPFGNLQVKNPEDPASKLIWITALDMGAPAGADPSHPAFLLPGQELGAGNTRAVLTLSTCGDPGDACTGGPECCSGSCGAEGTCVPARPCAWFDEPCGSLVDCCTGPVNGVTRRQLMCLGGYCGQTLE